MSEASRKHRVTLERVEVEAWRDMVMSAPTQTAAALGVQTHDVGGAVVDSTTAITPMEFNRVIGLGVGRPASDADIEAILDHFRQRRLARAFIQLHPDARPTGLRQRLEGRGIAHHNNWVKLHRKTDTIPPVRTALRIEQIDRARARDFSQIVTTAFEWGTRLAALIESAVGRPRWWHYLAVDGSRPVSAASMFVDGRYAWLGFAGTLAEARCRGAQSALLARRIQDAQVAGCTWLAIETAEEHPTRPEPSYRNVRRAGFEVAFVRPNYLWQATS